MIKLLLFSSLFFLSGFLQAKEPGQTRKVASNPDATNIQVYTIKANENGTTKQKWVDTDNGVVCYVNNYSNTAIACVKVENPK